jgi:hypothetical protein
MTIHSGPHDQLEAAYAALEEWIAANGFHPAGAPWEAYLNDPADSQSSGLENGGLLARGNLTIRIAHKRVPRRFGDSTARVPILGVLFPRRIDEVSARAIPACHFADGQYVIEGGNGTLKLCKIEPLTAVTTWPRG